MNIKKTVEEDSFFRRNFVRIEKNPVKEKEVKCLCG